MDLYKNKSNRRSIRLKHYNYRSHGYYFVTICTHEKICYFGNIQNQKVILSNLGIIAEKFWLEIPQHFNFVEIDRFVIMPNHIHGIVIINNTVEDLHAKPLENKNYSGTDNYNEDHLSRIMSNISPKKGSLSSVIRSYKSAVTRWSKLNNYDSFKWQSRFYEHIIRDENSLNNIREYIINNPMKWEEYENYRIN
jgi:REP element-mobilizing transposase RayT